MKRIIKPLLLSTTIGLSATSVANESHGIDRIVSAGNGVTEIIYALGAGDHVVAVDQTSTWPAEVNKLPRLGYHKQLSAEGILALQPSMLIGTTDMGPPSTLAQLESAGVEVEALPLDHSAVSIEKQITALAAILGKEAEGRSALARHRNVPE